MTDLQDRLTRIAPEVDVDAALGALRRDERRMNRRRRVVRVVAGGLVLAGLVAGFVATDRPTDEDPSVDDPSVTVTTVTPPSPVAEGWVRLAAAPYPYFETQATIWTGEEAIWFGGRYGTGDAIGMAYDPTADSWRVIPDAPIRSRADAAVVWTGDEMVVWGGSDEATGLPASGARYDTAGAAYDPATDSWRRIADAPIDPRDVAVGVWTGSELVVAGGQRWDGPPECPDRGTCLDEGRVGLPTPTELDDAAAYDPSTDTWRVLPSSPAPIDAGVEATWSGSEVWVFDQATGESAGGADVGSEVTHLAFDPADDSWRRLGAGTDDGVGLIAPVVEAAGATVLAYDVADVGEVPTHHRSWFRYDLDTDRWVGTDLPRVPGECFSSMEVVGDVVMLRGTCAQGIYVPSTDSWYPFAGRADPSGSTVGTDTALFVLPYADPGPGASDLWAYRGGFATIVVPDVVGLTLGEARRVMVDAGFRLRPHEGDPQGERDVVVSQEPPAGTPTVGISTANVVGVRTAPP